MTRIICDKCKNAFLQKNENGLLCPSCGATFPPEAEQLFTGIQYYNEGSFDKADDSLMKALVADGGSGRAMLYKALCEGFLAVSDAVSLEEVYRKSNFAFDSIPDEDFPSMLAVANDEAEKLEKQLVSEHLATLEAGDAEKIKKEVASILKFQEDAKAFRNDLLRKADAYNERAEKKIAVHLSSCYLVDPVCAKEIADHKHEKIKNDIAGRTVFTGILSNDIRNLEIYYRCVVMFFEKSKDKYNFLMESAKVFTELGEAIDNGNYPTLTGTAASTAEKLRNTAYTFFEDSLKEHDSPLGNGTVVEIEAAAEQAAPDENQPEPLDIVSDSSKAELLDTTPAAEAADETIDIVSNEEKLAQNEALKAETAEKAALNEEAPEETADAVSEEAPEEAADETADEEISEEAPAAGVTDETGATADETEAVPAQDSALSWEQTPDETEAEAKIARNETAAAERAADTEAPSERTVSEEKETAPSGDDTVEESTVPVTAAAEEAPAVEEAPKNQTKKEKKAAEKLEAQTAKEKAIREKEEAAIKAKKAKEDEKAAAQKAKEDEKAAAEKAKADARQAKKSGKKKKSVPEAAAKAAAEAEKAEESAQKPTEPAEVPKKKKKKKKHPVRTVILILLILAVAGGAYKYLPQIINQNKYKAACQLLAQQKYDEAAAAYQALGGFKDSADMVNECKYLNASSLCDSGKFSEAQQVYKSLGEYKDSVTKVDYCVYEQAKAALDAKKYDDAAQLFTSIKDYGNSADMVKECTYQKALALLDEKKYTESITLLLTIKDYSSASTKINEAKYEYVTEHLNLNDPLTAAYLDALVNANYRNSTDLKMELTGKGTVTVFANYSATDLHPAGSNTLDHTKTIYFHAVVRNSDYYGQKLTAKFVTQYGYTQETALTFTNKDTSGVVVYPVTNQKGYTVTFQLLTADGKSLGSVKVTVG